MSTTFVDTSALYALMDAADPAHAAAASAFAALSGTELVTHSYVLLEAVALVQRRLGVEAVSDLTEHLLRPVEVTWVDSELHAAGLRAVLASRQRQVSLVDHVSFEVMRRQRIGTAFAFDPDFQAQGFRTEPS